MRKLIVIYTGLLFFVLLSGFILHRSNTGLKNGDIVFIVNAGGQGKAVQLATKSKFTHVGIVFIENGKPMVYHAIEPVSKDSFEDFISMSTNKQYVVKRLKDQSLLTPVVINTMLEQAKKQLGMHYDIGFNWSDEELYCSEYVWKLYNKALNLEVGKLRPLKDFDLSHPAVKEIMEERYGKKIPYEEKMISPGDMYASDLLE